MSDALTVRVARAMYEAPHEGDGHVYKWPPRHPDDRAWWISRATAAIGAMR